MPIAAAPTTPFAFTTLDTPIGEVLLAATEEGLARVGLPGTDLDTAVGELAQQLGPATLATTPHLELARHEVSSFLNGQLRQFTVPLAHPPRQTPFQRAVLDELQRIPYGATQTYGEIAASIGHQGASRAVGSACATNPLPLVIPCHRVTRGDGTIGQFAGGSPLKQRLLDLERR